MYHNVKNVSQIRLDLFVSLVNILNFKKKVLNDGYGTWCELKVAERWQINLIYHSLIHIILHLSACVILLVVTRYEL